MRGKLKELQSWLDGQVKRVARLSRVQAADVDSVQIELAAAIQDAKEKRQTLDNALLDCERLSVASKELVHLGTSVAQGFQVSATTSLQIRTQVTMNYTVRFYIRQEHDKNLAAKLAAAQKWGAVLGWTKEAQEKLELIDQELTQSMTPEQAAGILPQLASNLNAVGVQVKEMQQQAEICQTLSDAACLQVDSCENLDDVLTKLDCAIGQKLVLVCVSLPLHSLQRLSFHIRLPLTSFSDR
jgi:hypothetical protein